MSSLGRPRQSLAWFARSFLSWSALGIGLALTAAGPIRAAAGGETSPEPETRLPSEAVPELAAGAPRFFKICRGRTGALCAVASCYGFDQVADCKCEVKHGDSISLPVKASATSTPPGPPMATWSARSACRTRSWRAAAWRFIPARAANPMAPTRNATGVCASPAPQPLPPFPASTSRCRPAGSSAPARSRPPAQTARASDTRSRVHTPARPTTSGTPEARSRTPGPGPRSRSARTLALLLNGPPVPPLNRCPSPRSAD
jgi:hypothetical protein